MGSVVVNSVGMQPTGNQFDFWVHPFFSAIIESEMFFASAGVKNSGN